MRNALLSTMVLFAASFGFAADAPSEPAPAPAPSIVGTWSLTSQECSSGTALNGGIRIGEDTMQATFNEDMSASFNSNITKCDSMVKGTYKLEGSLLTVTTTEGQSCKDANPLPMNETHTYFIAHLDDKVAVSVVTGDKAAKFCPAGDALVERYQREVVTE